MITKSLNHWVLICTLLILQQFAFSQSCEPPGEINVLDITSTTATITWTPVEGASKYEVNVEDGENNNIPFEVEHELSGLTFTVNGLSPGLNYHAKVRTYCSDDKSDWSEDINFTAGEGDSGGADGGTGGSACDIPTGLSISNNTGSSVTLQWSSAAGAINYEVEIEDDENTPLFNQEFRTSGLSQEVSGLTPGGSYKFKVKSECSSGSSDHSPWFFFTAGDDDSGGADDGTGGSACDIPNELRVIKIAENTIRIEWNEVFGALQYEVEIENLQTGAFHNTFTAVANFLEIGGIQENAQYKVKVKAECSLGSSDHTPDYVFDLTSLSNNGPGSLEILGSQVKNIAGSKSVRQKPIEIDLKVYPNPSVDYVYIEFNEEISSEGTLIIYDNLGNVVWMEKVFSTDNIIKINTHNLRGGLYYVRFRDDRKVGSRLIEVRR